PGAAGTKDDLSIFCPESGPYQEWRLAQDLRWATCNLHAHQSISRGVCQRFAVRGPEWRDGAFGPREQARLDGFKVADPDAGFPSRRGEGELGSIRRDADVEVGGVDLNIRRQRYFEARHAGGGLGFRPESVGRSGDGEKRDGGDRRPKPAAARGRRDDRLAAGGGRAGGCVQIDQFQRRFQVARRLPAVVRFLFHALAHDALERTGNQWLALVHGRGLVFENPGEDRGLRVAGERAAARDHFVHHDAQGEDIGAL